MTVLGTPRRHKAVAKRHTCSWCGERIEIGMYYHRSVQAGDDGVYTVKLHDECEAASKRLEYGDEWEFYSFTRGCTCESGDSGHGTYPTCTSQKPVPAESKPMFIAYHVPVATAVRKGVAPGWHRTDVAAFPTECRERVLELNATQGIPGTTRFDSANSLWNLHIGHPARGADLIFVFEDESHPANPVAAELVGCSSVTELLERITAGSAGRAEALAHMKQLAAQIKEARMHLQHLYDRQTAMVKEIDALVVEHDELAAKL